MEAQASPWTGVTLDGTTVPAHPVRAVGTPPERAGGLALAVERGLATTPKSLPCRFFYDGAGSELFEKITELPEYYLTRCEAEILEAHASEMVAGLGTVNLVELGSGSSSKTRTLLRSVLERQCEVDYFPIDISADALDGAARALVRDMPRARVRPLCGEYLDALATLPPRDTPSLFLFLGSNVGNFEDDAATGFLASLRRAMRPSDRLIVGLDLVKDKGVIERAYNDLAGVTAAFNKNLLARLNRELQAEFDLDAFDHRAPFVEERSRIEMRLVSKQAQAVRIGAIDQLFSFAAGESILTEVSTKYTPEHFASIAGRAGLKVSRSWQDSQGWFQVAALEHA